MYFFEFGPVAQMSFKDVSYLERWRPFCSAEGNHLCNCSAEWNHLCNFCRGHHEGHFCELILNLDQMSTFL